MVVLVPPLAILAVVSSQSGFSIHSRYILPAVPLLLVWTSKVGRVFDVMPSSRWRWAMASTAILGLAWTVASSLSVYPHSLSYFNELAAVLPTPADASYPTPIDGDHGDRSFLCKLNNVLTAGPRNGPRHLLDSNIDWGQDLCYLEDWYASRVSPQPIMVAYSGLNPLEQTKIKSAGFPPASPEEGQIDERTDQTAFGPLPGWYAVSVNHIYGRDQRYRYFLNFEPVAMAGYLIYIYNITLGEANRVRRALGLKQLVE